MRTIALLPDHFRGGQQTDFEVQVMVSDVDGTITLQKTEDTEEINITPKQARMLARVINEHLTGGFEHG